MRTIIVICFTLSILHLYSQNSLFDYSQSVEYKRIERLIASSNIVEASVLLDSLELYHNKFPRPLVRYYKARCMYKLGEFDVAIKKCSDEIAAYPKVDSLLKAFYFLKIDSYRELNRFTDAIYENQKLIKLFPKDVNTHFNISYLYGEVGDYSACFQALEKAQNIDPENANVLSNLSYYSSKLGEFGKAENYASKGMKFAKDSSIIGQLYNNRGFSKIGLRKYETAMDDIDKSLECKSINPYAYYNKALIYISLKEIDKACQSLNISKSQGGLNLTQELLNQYCR